MSFLVSTASTLRAHRSSREALAVPRTNGDSLDPPASGYINATSGLSPADSKGVRCAQRFSRDRRTSPSATGPTP